MNPKRRANKLHLLILIILGGITIGLTQAFADNWPQWAQNPQHTGFLNVAGQNLNKILANIVYDPLVPDEQALNDGDLRGIRTNSRGRVRTS